MEENTHLYDGSSVPPSMKIRIFLGPEVYSPQARVFQLGLVHHAKIPTEAFKTWEMAFRIPEDPTGPHHPDGLPVKTFLSDPEYFGVKKGHQFGLVTVIQGIRSDGKYGMVRGWYLERCEITGTRLEAAQTHSCDVLLGTTAKIVTLTQEQFLEITQRA